MKRLAAILLLISSARAAEWAEDFSTAPHRWQAHQNENDGAFAWDEPGQQLRVTWDSRRPNAFFYHPLETVLTRRDAFRFEFTLRIDDLQLGIDPAKTYTFPLGLGFINQREALRPDYYRGSGIHPAYGARSLVEFAYFPDGGLDATIAPVIASTNNQMAFSHTHPVELTPGETYHIQVDFNPAAQTLATTILHNGEPFGLPPENTIKPLIYAARFGDFQIDAFSIHSYSDAGQSPPQYSGSLLAHGIIDDIRLTYPDSPVKGFTGWRDGSRWIAQMHSQTGWNYDLERTVDFTNWNTVATGAGTGAMLQLVDDLPPSKQASYRLKAVRP